MRNNLDAITFTPLGGSETMTWEQSLAANYIDGIVVLHKGASSMSVISAHSSRRVSTSRSRVIKSFFGTIAAILVDEGRLDDKALVSHYLPELKDGAFGDATTILKEGEHGKGFTYRSPNAEVLTWLIRRVTGKSAGENLRERIWEKLGAEQDAYIHVDPHGNAGGRRAQEHGRAYRAAPPPARPAPDRRRGGRSRRP